MSTEASQHPSETRFTVIVMGVSGCGKTTFGHALAEALHLPFFDGDDLHSEEARAKMTAAVALNDSDRAPWLNRIGAMLANVGAHPQGAVIACSALRRAYRDRLRGTVGAGLRFVFLEGDKELMRKRVAGRSNHYMPASLIDSQFAALEPPAGESDVVTIAADAELAEAIADALPRLYANDAAQLQAKETP